MNIRGTEDGSVLEQDMSPRDPDVPEQVRQFAPKEAACSRLEVAHLPFRKRMVSIDEQRNEVAVGTSSCSTSSRLFQVLACTHRNPLSDLTDCTNTRKSIIAFWFAARLQ